MRPQSFAYVLFVGVLWLLFDDLRAPSRRIYLVLALLVLWANLHGSVVVGSALVSGYALIELAGSLWRKPRTVHGRSLVLLVAPWLCVLASPYATGLPHYYRTIFSGNFGSYVTEWAPDDAHARPPPDLPARARRRLAVRAHEGDGLGVRAARLRRPERARVRRGPQRGLARARSSLAVLPRLLDTLRSPAEEPRRLNRMLAIVICAGVTVATIGVAFKPVSWFTRSSTRLRPGTRRRPRPARRAACSRTRSSPTGSCSSIPSLSGRHRLRLTLRAPDGPIKCGRCRSSGTSSRAGARPSAAIGPGARQGRRRQADQRLGSGRGKRRVVAAARPGRGASRRR